ncbi:NACHT, LRR and PYD domains-containing protein 1 homolog [Engraulis encrasicolus]|uniref:NACHT, LRR and PYD domains-containing protein 1 homolog n=1 Tax=Engraulis encrasicolus TaxID=184585 RepID=UPI002FD4FF8F
MLSHENSSLASFANISEDDTGSITTSNNMEDGPSDDTQTGCKCCAEVPDTSHWVLVEPEVSTEKTVSIYSLSSAAGSYECSESSLRWSCVGPVTLQYHFMDWQVFAEELAQMQCSPAGPLMDVKLISGEPEEIHLPHFLCLGGSQSTMEDAVKVLHQQNAGVCLETCELSRYHARLLNPSFSPLGVLFNSLKSFLLTKIHTDVHVYRSSLKPLIFHVYLVPRNVQLKKLVEKQEKSESFRGVLLERPRPVRPLQLRSYYSLKTNCDSTVLPGELELSDDNTVTPNYSIVRVVQAGNFKITLLNSAQRAVWQAEISKAECCPPRQGTAHVSSGGPVFTLPCGDGAADTHTAMDQAMGWQEVQTPEYATCALQSGMMSQPVAFDILDWLFSALDDLDSDQLKRFKLYLSQRGAVQGFDPIPFGQLEQCDATGVASKVKQAYGEDGAVSVTLTILKRMKLHLLARRLER